MIDCPGVVTSVQSGTGYVLSCDQGWVISEQFLSLTDVGELASATLILFSVAYAVRFCVRFLTNR